MRAFISGSFYCQAYDKKVRGIFLSGSVIPCQNAISIIQKRQPHDGMVVFQCFSMN